MWPKYWETSSCRYPVSAVTGYMIIELGLQYITGALMVVGVSAVCREKWIVVIEIEQYTLFQLHLTVESYKPILKLQKE